METSVRRKDGIDVSANDQRDYRHLELENGLCVLLVSDAEAEKSAAAMDVHVGYHSDPNNLAGLAHFLEHMLFMGTEKYPDENSYSQYLSAHGGSSNAYTSGTDTNYYFDVRTPYFYEALDRFAQFFIAPLFTSDATEREMNAVNSENNKNLQNDAWRLDQIVKTTSNPNHPYHKFGTGNLVTLGTKPKEEVRAELIAFHAKYYSARIMKLVIVAKEDLDTLESWARKLFSPIEDKGMKTFVYDQVPFEAPQLQRRIHVTPVKDLRTIEIAWPLPPMRQDFLEKPTSILSHLLGHEGPGSLLSYLKKMKWVNELSAGLMKDHDDWSMFCVEVEATEAGITHVNDIVYAVYQYLYLLREKGIESWVFEEAKNIALMNFRFRSKETPINYASTLATKMQAYPVQYIVAGSFLLYEYNATKVAAVLQKLTPSNMRLTVVSKTFENSTQLIEPWYDTKYSNDKLSADLLHRWSNPSHEPSFVLPHPNAFIPQNFELVSNPTPDFAPVLVQDTDKGRLWVKTDTTFLKPKLNICMTLHSPMIYVSPTTAVLTDMYVRAVKDSLTEFTYDAELAGMRYSMSFTSKSLELYGGGYSDKLPILLQCIVKAMVSFDVNEVTFQRIHDKTKRSYENFEREDPYKHALYFSTCVLEDTKWTVAEKAAAIQYVTLDDLKNHAKLIFRQVYTESYFHGNVDIPSASAWLKKILEPLQGRPLFASQRQKSRAVQLTRGYDFEYAIPDLNPESVNSGVHTMFQLGEESIALRARNEVFAALLKEPCFNQLRTIEQLGYIVFSSSHRAHGIEYFRLIIQSDVAPPAYVEASIEQFLQTMRTTIVNMTYDEFKKYLQSVTDTLLEKPKTASEECSRFWEEISGETYHFTRRQEVANQVQTLTIDNIISFFDEYIAVSSPKRVKLSVHMLGSNHVTPAIATQEPLMDTNALTAAVASMVLDFNELNKDHRITVPIKNINRFKLTKPLFPERKTISVQVYQA
ncbi:insulin-degrading-like enzyme, metalloprotease family M16A [Thraustotheca clavata]|uniref:Insulin-degrading-like enzyme, metalloprotease family M16A n=1 Tax=Thraustotheca clavata TaxID=74557 RepID=A0A1W0A2G0_9STRA|nr:insulin-degrading-like enzyme, metalloprotease family M16A [Thraustotheca clavata]